MRDIQSESSLSSFLDRVYIASPCDASWDSMEGSDRLRNCGECSRQVFNLSDMSRVEAEAFLKENGTSPCLRFYRRKDGTIMTDDCPVGLRKIRNAARRVRRVAAVFLGTLISTCAAFAQAVGNDQNTSVTRSANPRNLPLWRKPRHVGVLQQLGSFDVTYHRPPKFDVPNYSELRSGQYALGKELVERQGRMFVAIDDSNTSPDKKFKRETLEPIPSKLVFFHGDLSAKILEAQGHIAAAEAFHKIYLKTLEAGSPDANSYLQLIASDYRDFLFRQKRIDDARQVEQTFSLEPEVITEGCEALKPISRKIQVRLPGIR